MKILLLLLLLVFLVSCGNYTTIKVKQESRIVERDTVIVCFLDTNRCDTLVGYNVLVGYTGGYVTLGRKRFYEISIYNNVPLQDPVRVEWYLKKSVRLDGRFH